MASSGTVDDDHVVSVLAHQLFHTPQHEQVVDSRGGAGDHVHDAQTVQLARQDPQPAALQVLRECRTGGDRQVVDAVGERWFVLLPVDSHVQDGQTGVCGNCRHRPGHHGFPDPAFPRNNESPGFGEEVACVHGFIGPGYDRTLRSDQ